MVKSNLVKLIESGVDLGFAEVTDEIRTRARTLMRERKITSLAEAQSVLLSRDPDLYRRYRDAQPMVDKSISRKGR